MIFCTSATEIRSIAANSSSIRRNLGSRDEGVQGDLGLVACSRTSESPAFLAERPTVRPGSVKGGAQAPRERAPFFGNTIASAMSRMFSSTVSLRNTDDSLRQVAEAVQRAHARASASR